MNECTIVIFEKPPSIFFPRPINSETTFYPQILTKYFWKIYFYFLHVCAYIYIKTLKNPKNKSASWGKC